MRFAQLMNDRNQWTGDRATPHAVTGWSHTGLRTCVSLYMRASETDTQAFIEQSHVQSVSTSVTNGLRKRMLFYAKVTVNILLTCASVALDEWEPRPI